MNERFSFRTILPEEAEQAADIEEVCFPPNEACSREMMRERAMAAPELFLVAVDKETGKLAGFLNGIATDERAFRDEFFTDASLHDPEGQTVMLCGLDVLPAYRKQGLARELVHRYRQREQARGRSRLVLTCHAAKIPMYERMGFRDLGESASVWGGETWHEMEALLAILPGRYRHFKGNEYEVIGLAKHSETLEPMVVYRALYGARGLWVRPASMWTEIVERDGKAFPRFERIEP